MVDGTKAENIKKKRIENISIDKHRILELLSDKTGSTVTSAQIGASLGLQVDVNLVSNAVLRQVKQLVKDGLLEASIEPLKGITINAVHYKTKTMLLEEELEKVKKENKLLKNKLFKHIKLYKPVIDSWLKDSTKLSVAV